MMRFYLTLFSFATTVLFDQPLLANASSHTTPYLNSPRRAVHTFLHWQLQGHEDPNLPALTMVADTSLTLAERQERARQLLMVFDAKGLVIDYRDIPNNPDYTDTLSGQQSFILFSKLPSIFLVRQDSNWVFAKSSVDRIPGLYSQTHSVLIDKLVDRLPHWSHRKWWMFEVWQMLAVIALVAAGGIFRRIFEYILEVYVHRWAAKTESKWDDTILDEAERPASLIIMLGFYYLTYANLRLPPELNQSLNLFLRAGLAINVIWLLYRLANVLSSYLAEMTAKTESKLDDQIVPLARKVIKVLVIVTGGLVVMQNFGINVGSIIAGLGIGGLAFALAAKDMLANLFGSVMIFLDKPFQIGDRIVVDGVDGIVEEVGFRSTRIRTFDNSLVSLPNSKVADGSVNNFGLRRYRRFRTILSIGYSSSPAQIEAFTEGIKALILQSTVTRKDAFDVAFFDFGENGLNILLNVFFETNDWNVEVQERHNLLVNIHQLADRLQIQFALPTRTLHIETMRRETVAPDPEAQALADAIKPGAITLKDPALVSQGTPINYQQKTG
jgi:MscS family membrane protein